MDNKINFTSAQYSQDLEGNNNSIKVIVDGIESFVPLVNGNTYYDEIQRQVAAGTLTIQDAD